MKRRIFTVLLVLGLCVGTAFAQFGFRGIVYDPTSYANAGLSCCQDNATWSHTLHSRRWEATYFLFDTSSSRATPLKSQPLQLTSGGRSV
ncbi:MAG: hypothetical protein ACRECH_13005 [Nitrososphaerales archaeon]